MQLYVVTTKCRAITDWFVPAYTDIAAALRSVQFPTDPPYTWVGPPRVVRRAIAGSGFDTYVTAILQKPDPPPGGRPSTAAQIRSALGERITRAVQAVDGCFAAVDVAPYFDVQNGPDLNWWSSGQAAQTRTRDAYPTLTGRILADENPVGPDTSAVRLPTIGEAGAQIGEGARNAVGSVLLPVAGIGLAIAAAVYLGPPVVAGLAIRFSNRKRKNPSGKRDDMLLPTVAVLGVGGAGAYYAFRSRTERAPVAATLPSPVATPAPAPSTPTLPIDPISVTPTRLTDAERALSNELLSDPVKRLVFYLRSMGYSYGLTDVPPSVDPRDPETMRLVRYFQAARGVPQDGVLNTATLRDVRRILEPRGPGSTAVRVIPQRLWSRAVAAVNNDVLGVAPGALLLQVRSLES